MHKKLWTILFVGAFTIGFLVVTGFLLANRDIPKDKPAPVLSPISANEPAPAPASETDSEAEPISGSEIVTDTPLSPSNYSLSDNWSASSAPPSDTWRGVTSAMTDPASVPPELKGHLLIFPDVRSDYTEKSLVLWDGRVIAQGDAISVTDFATGETVGFTMRSYLMDTDDPAEMYKFSEHCQVKYELFHTDGSFWYDTADLCITKVLGDYFFGGVDHNWNYPLYYTTDPSNPASRKDAPRIAHCGENRCIIADNENCDLFDGSGFYVVDSELNILAQYSPLPSYQCFNYFKNASGDDDVFLTWEKEGSKMIDLATLKEYRYLCGSEIADGYRVFRTLDDKFEVWDMDCNVLVKNCKNEIIAYNKQFRIERDLECYIVYYCGKPILKLPHDNKYTTFHFYLGNSSFFVYDLDSSTLTHYDAEGEILESIQDAQVDYFGYLRINNQYFLGDTFCTPEKSNYSYIRYLDYTFENYINHNRFAGLIADSYGCALSYDFLDENGRVIRSGFSNIQSTDYPGIYSAQRGLVHGLIDKDGNWIWSEYVFSENDDNIYYHGNRETK